MLLFFLPAVARGFAAGGRAVKPDRLFTRLVSGPASALRINFSGGPDSVPIVLVRDHPPDLGVIGVADQRPATQLTLTFGGFGGKDMAFKRAIALDFAGAGLLEALGGAFMCFQFRHKFLC